MLQLKPNVDFGGSSDELAEQLKLICRYVPMKPNYASAEVRDVCAAGTCKDAIRLAIANLPVDHYPCIPQRSEAWHVLREATPVTGTRVWDLLLLCSTPIRKRGDWGPKFKIKSYRKGKCCPQKSTNVDPLVGIQTALYASIGHLSAMTSMTKDHAGSGLFTLCKLEVNGLLKDRFDIEQLNALSDQFDIPDAFRQPDKLYSSQMIMQWGAAKEQMGILAAINALEKMMLHQDIPAGFKIAETGFTSAVSTASRRWGLQHNSGALWSESACMRHARTVCRHSNSEALDAVKITVKDKQVRVTELMGASPDALVQDHNGNTVAVLEIKCKVPFFYNDKGMADSRPYVS